MQLFVLVSLIVQQVIVLNIDNYSMLIEYLHLKKKKTEKFDVMKKEIEFTIFSATIF
jgi:hypothetical protein